ncbi:MAG: hypothetical protein PF440_07855 [Thiomicrorhabdus sp.]|jgi:thymidine kinase|nr:hypothetical protein [Thiomicrorhabdus sp.]
MIEHTFYNMARQEGKTTELVSVYHNEKHQGMNVKFIAKGEAESRNLTKNHGVNPSDIIKIYNGIEKIRGYKRNTTLILIDEVFKLTFMDYHAVCASFDNIYGLGTKT